jgi:hypothetical protein
MMPERMKASRIRSCALGVERASVPARKRTGSWPRCMCWRWPASSILQRVGCTAACAARIASSGREASGIGASIAAAASAEPVGPTRRRPGVSGASARRATFLGGGAAARDLRCCAWRGRSGVLKAARRDRRTWLGLPVRLVLGAWPRNPGFPEPRPGGSLSKVRVEAISYLRAQ